LSAKHNLSARATPTRRRFLQAGLFGGIGIPTLPALAAARELTSPSVAATPPAFELDEVAISDLQAGMASGKYSARSVAEKYLARIEEVDARGPALRSVIEVNPDALAMADSADAERTQKRLRGPMHGIPVLLKDNLDTADRMQTTAGSLALLGSTPVKDSFVAQRLREAGAVILGKTNLSEWANIRSSYSSSGWSARGGQTRNPYALDRNPCGSSSGSGAAVAANLCAAAVGTETDGSVICPSSTNGIVGIKPTLGLISRAGVIPIAHSQDTPGPMARTVRDAAILLSAMTGVDPRDRATAASQGKAAPDYTRFLDANGLRGARLGIARKYFAFSDQIDALINRCIAEMKSQGAEVVDPADLPTHGQFGKTEFTVLLYELKADLNAYLAGRPGAPQSLQAIIDFNERNRDREMPFFGQDIFITAQGKGPLTTPEYVDALNANLRLTRKEGIDAIMDRYHLDAIVAPSGSLAWLTDHVVGDRDVHESSNAAAVSGYPNITVPAGFISGLPTGISFFGRAWSEPTLLKIAYAFEQMTNARKPPQFLPTVTV